MIMICIPWSAQDSTAKPVTTFADLALEADGSDFGDDGKSGAVTLSLIELQTKMEPKAPQIKSFPWLDQDYLRWKRS